MNSESDIIHMGRHYRSKTQSRTVSSYLTMNSLEADHLAMKSYIIDPIRTSDGSLKDLCSAYPRLSKMNPIYN